VPACLNLRELFSTRYRISRDEAFDSLSDPWSHQIPGRCGTIYPFSATLLAVDIDGHPGVAKKVAALPGIRLHQDGDHEKTFVFPLGLFEQVAAIVKPRKRRRQTEEQKQASIVRLSGFQFQPARQSDS
jgi:hypothetical protein